MNRREKLRATQKRGKCPVKVLREASVRYTANNKFYLHASKCLRHYLSKPPVSQSHPMSGHGLPNVINIHQKPLTGRAVFLLLFFPLLTLHLIKKDPPLHQLLAMFYSWPGLAKFSARPLVRKYNTESTPLSFSPRTLDLSDGCVIV